MCVTQITSWLSPRERRLFHGHGHPPWGPLGVNSQDRGPRGGVRDPGGVCSGVCKGCHRGIPRKCLAQAPAQAPCFPPHGLLAVLGGTAARGTAGHGQVPPAVEAPSPGQCPGHVDLGPRRAGSNRGDPAAARTLRGGGGRFLWARHALCPPPGCSGALARECASLYPACRVTVFDIPEVVRTARTHFPVPEEEKERISFHEGGWSWWPGGGGGWSSWSRWPWIQ